MRVQIRHLRLRDLAALLHRHLADEAAAGGLRALLDLRGLLQEVAGRRSLGHEGERAIRKSGDHHRDRHALLQLLRRCVELLAELHDVQTALAERRTDRRRRIGLAGRNLQLDIAFNLLRHRPTSYLDGVPPSAGFVVKGPGWPPTCSGGPAAGRFRAQNSDGPQTFSTCVYSNSTGVARPKIDTATLSRPFSSSTSSTMPVKEVKGPSLTRTCSPTSKMIARFGRSMPSCTWCWIRIASASEIGVGLPLPPRKPVTFGVFMTRCQVSSVNSIFTST